MEAEGWYVDPFGVHAARWFSDGQPTALVRDDDSEGHDRPPSSTYAGPLVPYDGNPGEGLEDLRRADSSDDTYDPRAGVQAAWDQFTRLPKP